VFETRHGPDYSQEAKTSDLAVSLPARPIRGTLPTVTEASAWSGRAEPFVVPALSVLPIPARRITMKTLADIFE
jgi:hypothetical protein